MGWIKERILAEEKKHNKSGLDWARLAEDKIISQIRKNIVDSNAMINEADIQKQIADGEGIEFSFTGELIPVEVLDSLITGASLTSNKKAPSVEECKKQLREATEKIKSIPN